MQGAINPILGHFSALDGFALAFHLIVWTTLTWLIEHDVTGRKSAYTLMLSHRRAWMDTMVTREPRMFDALMLASLKQSATFFASACMLAVGAGAALIGQVDSVQGLASEITSTPADPIAWQIKLLVILAFVANALLKFLWAVRVYGYQAVLMSTVPEDPTASSAREIASKAAELNIYASRSFNRGLRAVYFALTALTWLVGPLALFLATIVTAIIVVRREYFSASRQALLPV